MWSQKLWSLEAPPLQFGHLAQFDRSVSCHVGDMLICPKNGSPKFVPPCKFFGAYLTTKMRFPSWVTTPNLIALGQIEWVYVGVVPKQLRVLGWASRVPPHLRSLKVTRISGTYEFLTNPSYLIHFQVKW